MVANAGLEHNPAMNNEQMSPVMAQQFELCANGFAAESAGNLEQAISLYREALELDASNPAPYLYLGYARANLGELDAAIQAYSLAADISANTVNAWRNPDLPVDMRTRSQHADNSIRTHFTLLHKQALDEFHQQNPAANIDRVYAAIWCATHDQAFDYRHEDQRPHLFYVPDLAPVSVFDPSDYGWCADLEAETDKIREEFIALWQNPAISGAPYIDDNATALDANWQPLINSNNWSSLHLYRENERFSQVIENAPLTDAALAKVPLLTTTYGQPRELLFSVLEGQQHIPPHYGLANTDMTVHLPLIIPEDAAIKVAGVTYPWQEGKLFLFDDAFIHESWNRSTETRVTLLFAAWHPDLTEDEQEAVAYSFEKREIWNQARRT